MSQVNTWPAGKKGSRYILPQSTGKAVLSTGNVSFT
jgi:hypothetical protein